MTSYWVEGLYYGETEKSDEGDPPVKSPFYRGGRG